MKACTGYTVEPSGTFWSVWRVWPDGTRVRCGLPFPELRSANLHRAWLTERHDLLRSAIREKAS